MNPSGAEEADRAGLKVVANISHELRTPLAAIVGMTELALLEELTPKVRDYLQTAKDSAEVLLRLLNDILDFSKMGAGGFALESSPFRLRAVLDETRRWFSAKAREKGLALACDLPGTVPDALVGDPLRLRQILANLVESLEQEMARLKEALIEHRLTADGGWGTADGGRGTADGGRGTGERA